MAEPWYIPVEAPLFVYDTTEVPGGIDFNPESLAARHLRGRGLLTAGSRTGGHTEEGVPPGRPPRTSAAVS